MKVKIDESYHGVGVCGEELVLHCAHCEGAWTHQEEVRAVWRAEDDVGQLSTSAFNKKGEELVPKSKCIGRRDWVEIDFSCESCSDISTLIIKQHKGNTFVSWKTT